MLYKVQFNTILISCVLFVLGILNVNASNEVLDTYSEDLSMYATPMNIVSGATYARNHAIKSELVRAITRIAKQEHVASLDTYSEQY